MTDIALFDLDKTITRKGTWSRFVQQASGGGLSFWAKLPFAGVQAIKYKAGLASRASVKEHAIRLYLEGRSRADLETEADTFVMREIANGLRTHVRDAIAMHKAAGDRLIIASAAVDLICAPMAQALGFEDIICTRLSWSDHNRLRAPLDGENCYGEEKLRRVKAFFGGARPSGVISFYSDHHTDLPCLLWADRGIAVNPTARLRRAASAHNLECVDWK